ncbi:MAG: ATP-binding protein, partial [Bacteroidota bacterium]|nr:ATP-binding protein [Bacteroidota bacterium]
LLGDILATEGKTADAIPYYRRAVEQAQLFNNASLEAENYQQIAKAFQSNHQLDSAFYYARKAYSIATSLNNPFNIADASNLLATLFKSNRQSDSAFKYLELVVAAKDSLFSQEKTQQVQNILFNEQLQQQELEAKHEKVHNQIKLMALLAGLVVLALIAFILYRNNKNKQRANELLEKQKEKLENTLTELKSTQAQLIQQEKMASLGELTAGIAHEIQNPLNFMNNFSEVNKELIDEMLHELAKGNKEEAEAIAGEIRENEYKINLHGRRADSIVKNMLQHSRKHTGQKEPTDINALAEEYMRLGYHGLRAKDKSFNAQLQTDFDTNIGKINVIPQDIGRVFLNLYNNAFYAVAGKKKVLKNGYEPMVSVSTRKLDNAVEISIRDNGPGISKKYIDKIFQPFFTTKPMGEGTGLGLSLSYDIITQGHGGEISVDAKEGEYAAFTIKLPLN